MLWITDLSKKDPYYVLPILMGVSMLVQQKMTPTVGDPRQAQIMLIMPVVFTFMFLEFPTGLVLYWLVNNVLSIGQQYLIDRSCGKAVGRRRADGHGGPQGRGRGPQRPDVAGDPWAELRAAAAALDLGLPPDFADAGPGLSGRARALGADRPADGVPDARPSASGTSCSSPSCCSGGAGARGAPARHRQRPRRAGADPEAGAARVGGASSSRRDRRRANFLRDVSRRLGLTGVTVHEGRAETLGTRAPRAGGSQTVTMRAVAGAEAAAALARPFLGPDGVLVRALGRAAAPERGLVREVALRGARGIALAAAVSYNPASGAGDGRSTWNTTGSRGASSRS